DLLTIEKELGRKLRGKNMTVITCSHGNNAGEAFWFPFKESANYLGMNYLGNAHTVIGKEYETIVDDFLSKISFIDDRNET
ncbi:MAG: FMN reductase, partial [Bacteroidota bacterium]